MFEYLCIDLGSYQHSILSDKIQEKTDEEGCHTGTECSFRDIFNNLLKIIGQPIRYYLELENSANAYDSELETGFELENSYSIQLVENSCNLITTIMSELVAQVTGIGYDSQVMSGQQLHITPSRFSRVSQNRTWNTGNGSPDAICFCVDRPGISIAGVTVYGGIGNEWHYELELLEYGTANGGQQVEDRSVPRDQQSHPWRTIEMAKGSYSFEDKSTDVCEIKLDRPVLIAANVKVCIDNCSESVPHLSYVLFSMQFVSKITARALTTATQGSHISEGRTTLPSLLATVP